MNKQQQSSHLVMALAIIAATMLTIFGIKIFILQ
jgi:hypothetical protein